MIYVVINNILGAITRRRKKKTINYNKARARACVLLMRFILKKNFAHPTLYGHLLYIYIITINTYIINWLL